MRIVVTGACFLLVACAATPQTMPPPPSSQLSDLAAWRLEIVKSPDSAATPAEAQINARDVSAVQACKDAAIKGQTYPPVPSFQNPRSDPQNPAATALQDLAYQINNCLEAGNGALSVIARPDPVLVKFLR